MTAAVIEEVMSRKNKLVISSSKLWRLNIWIKSYLDELYMFCILKISKKLPQARLHGVRKKGHNCATQNSIWLKRNVKNSKIVESKVEAICFLLLYYSSNSSVFETFQNEKFSSSVSIPTSSNQGWDLYSQAKYPGMEQRLSIFISPPYCPSF